MSADRVRETSANRREHDAKLVEMMIHEFPWSEQPYARMALAVAARAIRRGRHLTPAERMENLAKAAEADIADCETSEESEAMRKFAELLRSKFTESASVREVPGLTNEDR